MATSRNDEAEAIRVRKAQVQKEINSHKVIIDRGVFKKTEQEKVDLKNAKIKHKKSL